jgi:hypothetical protein
MIVLVTGGRDYFKAIEICQALDQLHSTNPLTMLVHGDAKGADRISARWAKDHGVHPCGIPALWDFYNLQAGTTRNTAMLNLPIAYCVAFPGGKGTADMVKQCTNKSIPIWKPYK